jgi:PAS domain S-box-containing protein
MRWPAFNESELLASAMATTGSVVLALRPDHTICYWNRAAERLYGLRADEARGRDYVATFIAPEQQALIAADIRKVLAGTPTWDFEDDSVLADGSRRTLIWNVCRFENAAGEVCGIVAAGHDITARKDAERAFRLVWDRSTEGLLLGGGPGIIDCNPAALAMLGLTDRSQLVGRHPMAFSPTVQPDGEASVEKARRMDAITKERGEHRFEWVHCKPDGTPVPTAVHVRLATLDGRKLTVIAWHDLTEQRATAERAGASRGRHRARLQQPAHGHRRQRGAGAARRAGRLAGRDGAAPGAGDHGARLGAGAAAAGVRAATRQFLSIPRPGRARALGGAAVASLAAGVGGAGDGGAGRAARGLG